MYYCLVSLLTTSCRCAKMTSLGNAIDVLRERTRSQETADLLRFSPLYRFIFHPFCRVHQEIPAPRELKGPRDLRSVSVSYFIYFAACFFCRLILHVLEEIVTLLSLSVFKNFGCIFFRGAVVFLDR